MLNLVFFAVHIGGESGECSASTTPHTHSLTRKQRKRLQRKLNKAASHGSRLEELGQANGHHQESDGEEEDLAGFVANVSKGNLKKKAQQQQPNGGSRFQIQPVVKTANKFELLDSSLHDDPTPIKARSCSIPLAVPPPMDARHVNGHIPTTTTEEDEDDDDYEEEDGVGGRERRRQRHSSYRSQSTSPKRMGQTERRRAIYRNYM